MAESESDRNARWAAEYERAAEEARERDRREKDEWASREAKECERQAERLRGGW